MATILERKFIFKEHQNDKHETKLTDPSPHFTPQQVLNFYAASYTMLTIATIEGPEIKDDEIQYRFKTTLGTKG